MKQSDLTIMKLSALNCLAAVLLGSMTLTTIAPPALAQQVSREQDIVNLRLGQRIKVDDGTCPAGQVKEVSGTRMAAGGVVRSSKCIPRLGPKTMAK